MKFDHFVIPSMLHRSHTSLTFDGLTDIMFVLSGFADTFRIAPTQDSSISMWVKNTKADTSGSGQQTLMSRWFSTSTAAINEGGWRMYLWDTTFGATPNTTRAMVIQLSTSIFNGLWVHTTDSFPLDEWVHVVMTYDGSASVSGVKCYWDGVEKNLVTVLGSWSGTPPSSSTTHMMWGAQYTAWFPGGGNPDVPEIPRYHFEGLMDETAVWRFELSATEVLELYHGGKPANPIHVGRAASKPSQGWWRMGDGSDGAPFSGVFGICFGRWRADAPPRNAFWNNDGFSPPVRLSTDVPA